MNVNENRYILNANPKIDAKFGFSKGGLKNSSIDISYCFVSLIHQA
jgi:hypothetical protein